MSPRQPERPAAVLFAVHDAERGGAQLMALEDAEHLAQRHRLVVSLPDGPLSDAFATHGELVRGSPRLPVWATTAAPWIKQGVRTIVDALRTAVLIRRRRIRAVMVNSSVLLGPVIAARLARVPVIVHIRETPATAGARAVLALHERLADTLICVSGAVESHLGGRGRARVVRIPDGIVIPPRSEPPGDGFHSPLRLCVIGSVNGDWSKGQDVAVEAVGDLARRGVAATLELVGPIQGDGLADDLQRRAARLGVADQVHVRGPSERIDEVIRSTDIVLSCSRIEPLGLVPAEALARQRPVIAAATGGLPEVVRAGETGLLVPPADPAALADAIAELAADPQRARALAAAGRQDVSRRFDTRVARAAVEAELDRLL